MVDYDYRTPMNKLAEAAATAAEAYKRLVDIEQVRMEWEVEDRNPSALPQPADSPFIGDHGGQSDYLTGMTLAKLKIIVRGLELAENQGDVNDHVRQLRNLFGMGNA